MGCFNKDNPAPSAATNWGSDTMPTGTKEGPLGIEIQTGGGDVSGFQKAAEVQAASSKENTEAQIAANRPNITTPTGSQTWNKDANGNWTMNTALTSEGQAALDAQMGVQQTRSQLADQLSGRLQSELGTSMDWNALPAAGQSLQAKNLATSLDFSGAGEMPDATKAREDAYNAIYGQATARLHPQWAKQQEAADVALRNQGLMPGDEAYDRAMSQLSTQKTDAYQTAMNNAQIGAESAAQGEFSRGLAGRQQSVGEVTSQAEFMNQAAAQGLSQDQAVSAYQNQLRQQSIAEELQKRGMTLSEINALLSGQNQGTTFETPGFMGATGAESTQALAAEQAAYQADLDRYNAGAGQQTTAGKLLDPGKLFNF